VVRLCHPGSGMAKVRDNDTARERSDAEGAQLVKRFGRRPW